MIWMTFRLTNQTPIDINGDLLSNWDEENLSECIAFNCLNSKKFKHKYIKEINSFQFTIYISINFIVFFPRISMVNWRLNYIAIGPLRTIIDFIVQLS